METLVFILITVTIAIPCASAQRPINAICVMRNGNVRGMITLQQEQYGLNTRITGSITGLTPGMHGLHVHEFGDITTCNAAGGHYNPTGVTHGDPADDRRPFHVGDLGNIASVRGVVRVAINSPIIKLNGRQSVIGRALVVHQNRDDLGLSRNPNSLINGNSGARVGCCVIGIAEPSPRR